MFWRGMGNVLCSYIGVCDGRLKNRDWGRDPGQKEAPIWAKGDLIWTKSMKSGRKSSRIGGENSIINEFKPHSNFGGWDSMHNAAATCSLIVSTSLPQLESPAHSLKIQRTSAKEMCRG